jgi:hypothetical protein
VSATITTFTGRRVALELAEPAHVDIADIAWALGHINRFTGHAGAYTVADHSVIVSHLVPPQYAPRALLHDAAEAYLGDLSRPLKEALWRAGQLSLYRSFERDWDAAIAAALLSSHPLPSWAELDAIKFANCQALWIEKTMILGCDHVWRPRHDQAPPPRERLDAALRALDAVLDPKPGFSPWSRFLHRAIELRLASPADDARIVQRHLDVSDAARAWRAGQGSTA